MACQFPIFLFHNKNSSYRDHELKNSFVSEGQRVKSNFDVLFDKQHDNEFILFKKHYKKGWRAYKICTVESQVQTRIRTRNYKRPPAWNMTYKSNTTLNNVNAINNLIEKEFVGNLDKKNLMKILQCVPEQNNYRWNGIVTVK